MNNGIFKVNKCELISKLGYKFLVHMLALMDGLNRLDSQLDFLVLNYLNDKNHETVRWNRNFLNAIFISMGLLWEVYRKLKDMKKIEILDKTPSIKNKLDELLEVFHKPGFPELLRMFRNQLSFHIDICNICKGIDEIKDEIVELIARDSDHAVDSQYVFATLTLWKGFLKLNRNLLSQLSNTDYPLPKNGDIGEMREVKILYSYLKEIHYSTMQKIDELIQLIMKEFSIQIIA